jgi:uncharacterized protein (DUF2062 family)
MQRWLKRITPCRAQIEEVWYLKPFTALVVNSACWQFHRNNVIRAFALGLFIAFIPPTPLLPVHFVVCTILALVFRLNLPVLFATVFVSNPFTWLPQVIGSIWVGAKLLNVDLGPILHHLSYRNIGAHVHQLWEPLFLGALVLGAVTSFLGYVLAQCLWRARVLHQLRRRRLRAGARRPPLDQDPVA